MATKYNHPSATKRTTLTAIVRNTAYVVGDKRKPTSATNRLWLECTTAGTSHATTEPTWNTAYGGTTTDGTAVFTTRGTGDSYTPADRCFHIEDTYSGATNSNGIAAGDVVLSVCNAGAYTLAAALSLTIAGTSTNPVFHAPVTDAGVVDLEDTIDFDASGLASGVAFTVGYNYNIMAGVTPYSGPSHGISITSGGDGAILLNCSPHGNVGDGIHFPASGMGVVYLEHCNPYDNTGMGFQSDIGAVEWTGSSCQLVILNRCFPHNNDSAGGTRYEAYIFNAIFINCDIIKDVAVTGTGSFYGFFGGTYSIISGCTMRSTATHTTTGFIRGGHVEAGIAINSIAAEFNGASVSATSCGIGVTRALVGGNVLHGNKYAYNGTLSVDGENGSPDTTDPVFMSDTDSTPTADLSGKALYNNVSGEANWIIPGAIPASGGGAGGVYPPRVRRHGV